MKETYNVKGLKLEQKLEDKLMALKSENLAHYILKKTYSVRGVEKRVLLSTFDNSLLQSSKRRSKRIILFLTFPCTVGYQL